MATPKDGWRGAKNPRWKGGVCRSNGYILVFSPSHHRADKRGYVRQHILVAEEKIGRALLECEVVHHENGVKDDNRPENLHVMTRASHTSEHHKNVHKPNSERNLQRMTSERAKLIWQTTRVKVKHVHVCTHCQVTFEGERKKNRPVYCSKTCAGKANSMAR